MPAGLYTGQYQAGGSGSNYIPDGYIKSTMKIWTDVYTIAFTNTNSTIDICVLPPNKRVLSIIVDVATTVTQTNGTIAVGFSTDANVDTFLAATTISHNATRTSIDLPGGFVMNGTSTSSTIVVGAQGGFQFVTVGTQTTISVKLNNWTMTSGTLKTLVQYS